MRFLVEVNGLGQPEAKRYGIEADTWQKALQETRKLRGEDGPLSGFSIELLDDGCRAVDPMARLRYLIRKAEANVGLGPLEDGRASVTARPKEPAPAAGPSAAPVPRAAAVPVVAPQEARAPASSAAPKSAGPTSTAAPKSAGPASSAAPTSARGPASGIATSGPSSARAPISSAVPTMAAPISVRSPASVAGTPAVPPVAASAPPRPTSQRPQALQSAGVGAPVHVPPAPTTQPMLPQEPAPPRPAVTPAAPPVAAAAPAHVVAVPVTGAQARNAPPAAHAPHAAALPVLSRREQAPTATLPLYYREEAVLVRGAPADPELERQLLAHLTALGPELATRPRGRYVQIAAFDAPIPPGTRPKPLAVLSWKDWRPEPPSMSYPARPASGRAPRPGPDANGPHVAISAMTAAPMPAMAAPAAPAPVPAAPIASPLAAPGAAPSAPPFADPFRPAAAASAPSPLGVVAQPASFNPIVVTPSSPGFAAVAPARPSSSSGFPAADGSRRRVLGDRRVPGEELIAQLFEEMHAVHFLADALEGGHFCLMVAMEKLPSKLALVHLYDIDKREFVIVCTWGPGTELLLLDRVGESDPLLAAAMRKRRAVVINDPSEEAGTTAVRFGDGGAKRVIVTPVMQAGRFLGAIEIVNPVDGAPFTELEGNAMSYMAEQYADFVASRGVVFEPEKVSRASQAARA